MNPALRDFWATKSRYKVLYGGRGSSKSHDACGRLTYLTRNYKLKILAVRQYQNKIEDSVYTLLKDKIEAYGYSDDFRILNNKIHSIETESEFLFYGINRNITEIKSTENVDILYIEEAHALTEEQWKVLKPTIRKNNSEIWLIFNPDLITDFVYKRFILNPLKDCLVRHINYTENPFASDTFLNEVEDAKEEDFEEYEHIYLGTPRQQDEEAFVKTAWIEAAIDSHKKLNIEVVGDKTVGYDIADSGKDKCATVERYGIITVLIKEWKAKEDELEESAEKTYNQADMIGAKIIYDCIGVGASAGSTFKRLNKEQGKKIKFVKFDAGDKVQNPEKFYQPQRKNKDHFENLKAQMWQEVADRLKTTYNAVVRGKKYNEDDIISISSECSNIDLLKIELSTPKKDRSKRGLVKVESKEDLAKRGIPSPNIADAFIMAYYVPKSNGLSNAMFD